MEDAEWDFDDATLEHWGARYAALEDEFIDAELDLPPDEQHNGRWCQGRAVLQLAYELMSMVLGDAVSLGDAESDSVDTGDHGV